MRHTSTPEYYMEDSISTHINSNSCYIQKKPQQRINLTGRDQLVSNVIFNWAGHFVFIITGFILPRMIDQRLGQELLGIWDFAWSLVSYFQLVGLGIASSVNRYVAKYRMARNISALNGIVSTAFLIMSISGVLVLVLSIAVSLLLPQLFGTRLGENIHVAQWIVFFLGTSIGIEIAFGTFNGILTGCHRWGLQNIIQSGWHTIIIIGMIIALLIGKGLRILSLIYLIGIVLAFATRLILAYRICEGLRIHPSLVKWEIIRKVFAFGGKTLIPRVSELFLNQTTNVLIVVYLGPAMLALYARPRSLIYHVNTLVKKMAFVLIPTTSSLQSEGNIQEIRDLLLQSVRYAFYIVLPIVLVMVVFGGALMQFWMGPRYGNGLIPATLAVGFLMTMIQAPIWPILVGLNEHGRAGIAELIASLCSVTLSIVVLGYLKGGLAGVAVAVTVPMTIMNVAYLPFLISRKVKLNVKQYFRSVIVGPVVLVLPFALCLVIARFVFKSEPLIGLLCGGIIGGTVLIALYYRYVLPNRIKIRFISYVRMKSSIV